MSSGTVERQYNDLGKALGNVLLQSQHTQSCGRGELRGVRELKADLGKASLWGFWQWLGHFPTNSSFLQWLKPAEAASAGGSSRWGVWHTCRQVVFLKHGCKPQSRTQAGTTPWKIQASKESPHHRISCLQLIISFTSSWGEAGSAAVSRNPEGWNKVPALPLAPRCPWHVGSCVQPLPWRRAVLPPQSEGRSCTSVKLLKRVQTFCWVTASTLGNLDQKKMMGVWW